MKKTIFTLLFSIGILMSANAQFTSYIRLSGDIGIVSNSEKDKKFGVGGTVSWLTVDNLISGNEYNYISLGIKGFNNPYGEGKLFSSIMNDEDDGFNYIMPLLGYRFTQKGVEEGFFIEPRIGAAFGASYTAFAISPLAGYSFNNLDFSIYCDMGFGSEISAIQKKSFFTPGLSIAYSFGF
ncbi:MAG: hypothetical protein PHO13_00615 [Fermentimonas sp.]|jgi:hypothetical protein|nr:hypothetical protein [Fermentimonas sp.]NLC86443.1 hypothetical protein [Bacteroidales bacterium]HBT85864.1 hypothetical protein [Porphyromonadaceae bacterium]MDD2930059.1 hypothetical protein [Fermentimonas sp.]MDD3187980.1 hypothetical protein [Fermentimonas sp.]